MRVLIVDHHAIYRLGMSACLTGCDEVSKIWEAESVADAWSSGAAQECELVIVDQDAPGALEFIRQVRSTAGARAIVCAASCTQTGVIAAVESGATGYLRKEDLTAEQLRSAVAAAANGAGVMEPELLGQLLDGVATASREVLTGRGLSLNRLNAREREVLSLVAAGHPIREVAQELRYSERTIKNVIHDVVTKMNVRSRSQAVAEAVREGLI